MPRITVKEYRAANGGDYDRYLLSDGRVYWLWLKTPFKGSDAALVHILTDDDKEVGTVYMEKTIYGTLRMSLDNSDRKTVRHTEVKISLMQDVRPNKKYYFDKIIRHLLM